MAASSLRRCGASRADCMAACLLARHSTYGARYVKCNIAGFRAAQRGKRRRQGGVSSCFCHATNMTIADDARAASLCFEAVKMSYRQSGAGFVISLVIHPNEMPDALATAPLGSRWAVAMVRRGDDELPVSPDPPPPTAESRPPASEAPQTMPGGANLMTSLAAKDRYRNLDPRKQAVARAGMLEANRRFWAWAGVSSTIEAADYIRRTCGVSSRSALETDEIACMRYLTMEAHYQGDAGLLAEVR